MMHDEAYFRLMARMIKVMFGPPSEGSAAEAECIRLELAEKKERDARH